MKTLYLECNMGAAGDMLMAALLEVCPDPEGFLTTMNALGIPGVVVKQSESVKCGIRGTHITVEIYGKEEDLGQDVHHQHEHEHDHDHSREHGHDHSHTHHDLDSDHPPICESHGHSHAEEHVHSHSHSSLRDIEGLIQNLPISEKVKADAIAVYRLIAEAESYVHGKTVEEIHFHEVGQLDAIADIVGVCLLMEQIAPDQVIVSPLHVGFGQVKTAHGILPVPAPATAYLLKGMPSYSRGIRGELLTPTGAALLKHFANGYSELPSMYIEKIGYGMGKKDFEAANCVRAILGESESLNRPNDEIAELSCNLDDMTPEAIGYALEQLLGHGALDAFVEPVQMKKNRPAQLLTCLCPIQKAGEVATLMLRHTTTIGVRQKICKRYILQSSQEQVQTPYGFVRIKHSTGYGIEKCKPEFEDVSLCAKESGVSFEEVYRATFLAVERE